MKDVSAFANTRGGTIVIGAKEKEGICQEIIGIKINNEDALKRQIGQIIDNNTNPRIPKIDMHSFKLNNGNFMFCIQVPESLCGPHQIIKKGIKTFCIGNDSYTYEPEADELRRLFIGSEYLMEKIESFRKKCIEKILNRETPAAPSS